MPELRWTLLILGALFIGVLAIWEIRRKRHSRGQDANAPASREAERIAPTLDEGSPIHRPATAGEKSRGDSRMLREPTITFPDVHLDARGERAAVVARPPVVEIDDASLADLKIEPHTVVDEFSAVDRSRASDEALGLAPTLPMGSRAPTVPAAPAGTSSAGPRVAAPAFARASETPDAPEPPRTIAEPLPEPAYEETPIVEEDDGLPVAASAAESEVLGPPVVREASTPLLTPEAFETPEPIVDWPDESTRKIIALRLVSTGERFPGRAVRQALAAEGFQIGKFEIFHKPGPDARAVLSAASLTKPGTFSLNTMDGQRYGGLSLFAVLPGPLSPVETFDELLLTARGLNDRLRGALQDERGEPLTPTRSASIRESLAPSASGTPY